MNQDEQTIINVPLNWAPRPYQMNLWNALEGGCKRAVAVWHRRAGKDLCSINWTVTQAFQRPGLYWHILPTYRQGRKIVWEGMTGAGRSFVSHWPDELVTRKRDDEMSLWIDTGRGTALWQVIGADDVDRLVGTNPVGCVFSEYSLQDPRVWNLIRPILAENGGWALFIYTPRGRNHGFRLAEMARENDTWFYEALSVDDTGVLTDEQIQEERDAGMPEELIQQEFYVSFDAPLVGSYYGDLMSEAAKKDRFTRVPWEPKLPVVTAWDLGIGDYTAIWFCQMLRSEVRLIDYYQASGMGLDHFSKLVHEKPYTYQEHLAPHDIEVRELGTGKSRKEIARDLGIRFRVVPKLSLEDGINAARMLLPRCWFDEKACETGIQALREYRKEWSAELEQFRDKPRHDWTSHAADAFRYLAVGLRPPMGKREILAPKLPIV